MHTAPKLTFLSDGGILIDLPVWFAMSKYGVVSGSTTISAAARPKELH
jgi:hypothetical protein